MILCENPVLVIFILHSSLVIDLRRFIEADLSGILLAALSACCIVVLFRTTLLAVANMQSIDLSCTYFRHLHFTSFYRAVMQQEFLTHAEIMNRS